jgi:hypothetical protein
MCTTEPVALEPGALESGMAAGNLGRYNSSSRTEQYVMGTKNALLVLEIRINA